MQALRRSSQRRVSYPEADGLRYCSNRKTTGPVLFILFVNDICDVVPSGVNLKLFADDVKLYSVINSTVTPDSLQACLSAIHDWSEHWQLKLSPASALCCTFHPTQRPIELHTVYV